LPGVQHRRPADAAGRSTAVPGLPAGGAVRLDLPPPGALGSPGRAAADAVLRLGYAAIRKRADRRAAPRSIAGRALAPLGRAQLRGPRARDAHRRVRARAV